MFELPSRFVRVVDSRVWSLPPPAGTENTAAAMPFCSSVFGHLGRGKLENFQKSFKLACLGCGWVFGFASPPEVWGHDPKHGGGTP